MLPEAKLNILQELISTSSREEIIWINGYLNGLVSGKPQNGEVRPARISILYGTETGNSKKLALQFTTEARKNSIAPKCIALDQYRTEDLAKEELVFIIISTQGEGEPPEAAKKFYDYLHSTKDNLGNLKYGVLALGDSSYPLFCKTGEDVDNQLQRLGAMRIVPTVKCDVDFEQPAAEWFSLVISAVRPSASAAVTATNITTTSNRNGKATARKHIEGTITRSVNLNDRGSASRTWHMEIRAEEDMDYEPGDSIAIVPENRKEVVERILKLTGVDPEQKVELPKAEGSIRELLTSRLNICYLLTATVKKYAALTRQDIPEMRMDLVDLIGIYPPPRELDFREVLGLLNPIAPRLYSVSSSAKADPREVHITVGLNGFLKEDEQRYGLCSSFLGDLPVGSKIGFHIHRNRSFRLPDADKDIIMVGPGTGIAPFRSFLQERDIDGAPGRNWLFFGEMDFTKDFLYQAEIQQYHQTGVLHNVTLAFAREVVKPSSVQEKLREQGAEVFAWIAKGASFYLSGEKSPMSQEVEKELLSIIGTHGACSPEDAVKYLENLKKEGRYQKDVY
jgi:sulfite reductase (NADPH) flavoprotein alpha-component